MSWRVDPARANTHQNRWVITEFFCAVRWCKWSVPFDNLHRLSKICGFESFNSCLLPVLVSAFHLLIWMYMPTALYVYIYIDRYIYIYCIWMHVCEHYYCFSIFTISIWKNHGSNMYRRSHLHLAFSLPADPPATARELTERPLTGEWSSKVATIIIRNHKR